MPKLSISSYNNNDAGPPAITSIIPCLHKHTHTHNQNGLLCCRRRFACKTWILNYRHKICLRRSWALPFDMRAVFVYAYSPTTQKKVFIEWKRHQTNYQLLSSRQMHIDFGLPFVGWLVIVVSWYGPQCNDVSPLLPTKICNTHIRWGLHWMPASFWILAFSDETCTRAVHRALPNVYIAHTHIHRINWSKPSKPWLMPDDDATLPSRFLRGLLARSLRRRTSKEKK